MNADFHESSNMQLLTIMVIAELKDVGVQWRTLG